MSSQPNPSILSPAERERVVRVASSQRIINLVVLVYWVVVFAAARHMRTFRTDPVFDLLFPVIIVVVVLAGMMFAVRLAISLEGRNAAIVYAILLLVPVVGLFAMLVLNRRATRLLRQAGLRVGLLGVSPRQFVDWEIARGAARYRR